MAEVPGVRYKALRLDDVEVEDLSTAFVEASTFIGAPSPSSFALPFSSQCPLRLSLYVLLDRFINIAFHFFCHK